MDYAITDGLNAACDAGKMCVNPAMFADLCYKADAIKLGVLCFFAGIALVLILQGIEEYLNGSN